MPETKSHKQAKRKAPGKTEAPIKGGRRLDSQSPKTSTEVERNPQNIPKAVKRLKDSGTPRKVLQVPQKDMETAKDEMRKQGVKGTIKNMGDTKKTRVR